MKTNYTHKILFTILLAFISLSSNATDHTLNQPSGSFSVLGTNYINNMYEVWYINTGVSKPVKLDFNIDIEGGFDEIDVYSIDTNGNVSADPIATYTGIINGGQTSTLVPSGRAKIVFHSDGSVSNDNGLNGFDMSFSVDNIVSEDLFINGKLGIGTSNPGKIVEVSGLSSTSGIRLRNTDSNFPGYLDFYNDGSAHFAADNTGVRAVYFSGNNIGFRATAAGISNVLINSQGYLGVGTLYPQSKLDVQGDINIGGMIGINVANDRSTYDSKQFGNYSMGWFSDSWSPNGPTLWQSAWGGMKFFTSGIPRLSITSNGYVGIGLTNPDAMLTVNGIIHAKEVKVDLTGPLADYVFDTKYKLMPLHEVEQYVKTNSHLPEIPSAAEVSKNGLNMGEMQNKLLQKVEELTLYMIDQQKTINQQSAKIEELEKKLK